MSVKEQLAAKRRRTITVPVQVTDPGSAQERYDNAAARVMLLQLGQGDEPATNLEEAQSLRDDAAADLAVHYVDVEFQSMPPADVERLMAAHTDSNGETDEVLLTPALAAFCAVDEELRDEPWWVERFTSGEWSIGERVGIYAKLLDINLGVPEGGAPKG